MSEVGREQSERYPRTSPRRFPVEQIGLVNIKIKIKINIIIFTDIAHILFYLL
jgi:hypothetical protein